MVIISLCVIYPDPLYGGAFRRRLVGGERERHLRAMEDATSSPGRTRAASSGTRTRPGHFVNIYGHFFTVSGVESGSTPELDGRERGPSVCVSPRARVEGRSRAKHAPGHPYGRREGIFRARIRGRAPREGNSCTITATIDTSLGWKIHPRPRR